MSKSKHIKTCNEAVQTIIHCYPHILKENQFTKVYSNHSCQTAITISPKLENINIYPSLEFIPYERITENSIRELDLPRKAFLHWRLPSTLDSSSHHLFSPSFNRTVSSIYDEVHQKGVLKKSSTSSIAGHRFLSIHHRYQRIMNTQGAQTTLNVSPHVLDADEVATVYIERCVQTSVTCTPNASISSLVPLLEANLTHMQESNANTEFLQFEVFHTKTSIESRPKKISEKPITVQSTESMNIYERFAKKHMLQEVEESQLSDIPSYLEAKEIGTEFINQIKATESISNTVPSIHMDFESIPNTFDKDDTYEAAVGGNLFSNAKSDIPKTSTNDSQLRSVVSDGDTPETTTSSISNQKSACSRKCLCGNRKLNSIAHKLRVQASTLKLSQKVFPPGVQFEERIIEVLNTTVALFQTEMANILEVYVDDNDKTESCLSCNQETDETDDQSYQIKQEDFESIRTLVTQEFIDQDYESIESYCKPLKNACGNEKLSKVESERSNVSTYEEAEVIPEVLDDVPPAETDREQPSLSHPEQPAGDFLDNRRLNFISCECHPTEAGAAPSLLNINTPTTSRQEEPNIVQSPAIPTDPDQSLFPNPPAPSWVSDNSSPSENNLKFEVLLKNTMKDVESSSDASTLAIRATISCPNTEKSIKATKKTTTSLPDLREQVIRLSILYKSKSTDSEKLVEESLPPPKVQIQMSSGGSSHLEAFESELLIRCTSCKCNNSFSTIGKKQSKNKTTVGLPSKAKLSSEIHSSHIKVENVRFSSMTCPIHPDKASCPPVPILRTSIIPQQQKQSCVQPSSKGNIEITVSCHLSLDSYKNDENDEKFSLMYEHEEEYDEPYIALLYEEGSSTGVQTDIALGEKLESTSLNSINPDEETEQNVVDDVCDSKTEIPWQTISLPIPGSYIIKQQEKIPYVPYTYDTSEDEESEPSEHAVEFSIDEVIETPEPEAETEAEPEPVVEEVSASEEISEPGMEDDGGENEDDEEKKEEDEIEENEEEGEVAVVEGTEDESAEAVVEDTALEGEEEEEEEQESETLEFVEAEDKPIDPCDGVIMSKKSERLIFQIDHQINEPYMEGLFKAFPEPVHKDSCTSHTEMPWEDIVLPEHCTIRKIIKPVEIQEKVEETVRMCRCRGPTENNLPAGEDDVVQLHVGFDEPESTLMPVDRQTTSVVTSEYSDMHEMAKRVGKDYTFSISTSKGASSSVIVNIKPSTDCQFPSQKIAVCDDSYNTGKSITASQSESEIAGEDEDQAEIGTRGSASLPQMKVSKTARATISVKRLGLPDQTIIQKKQLTPGDNIMTIKIPDEPIKINVKFTAPPLKPKDAPICDITCEPEVPEEEIPNEEIPEEQPEAETEAEPEAEPEENENEEEEKIEETEPIKEEPEITPFKRDPIGSMLKAYETEMKPLREALAQLHEKILSLNIPEIQAILCPATVIPAPSVRRPSLSKPCRPPTCPIRSKHQVPPRLSFSPQADSSYNTFSSRSPGEHRTTCPNSHYPFMAQNSVNSNASPYHSGYESRESRQLYDEPSFMESTRSSKSRQQKLERHPFRMQEFPYPKKDLAMQARNYGMYPDYRGRAYPDERIAYQNSYEEYSFEDDLAEKSPSRKFKIRHVISVHSKSKMEDRDCGSKEHTDRSSKPRTSDKSTNKCRDSSTRRRSSRKSSQTGNNTKENCMACKLRPGQAVKTSPDEFLPQVKRHKTESVGTCTSSRIKITIPLESKF